MIIFNVPYEAGFKSGTKQFTDLTEAIEFAKTAYGDLYATVSIQLLNNNEPIYTEEEGMKILKYLNSVSSQNG